jgi:hypothetical protein
VSTQRKRLGATLLALHHKGLVRQDGHVAGLIGWRSVETALVRPTLQPKIRVSSS